MRDPADRVERAGRRTEDRRMRFLVGRRPGIHIFEIEVFALVDKRPGLRPGADDEVVRLLKASQRFRRIDAEGMILRANAAHEAGDEASARDVVEHREFLRDRQRIVDERQRPAEHGELALDAPRQRARHDAGNRHQPVGGLMVLVDDLPVKAKRIRVLHLVEILVVEFRALDRVVLLVRQRDPRGAGVADRLKVHVRVGHKVEVEDFHAETLCPAMKVETMAASSAGFSNAARCPHPAMVSSFAPGMRSRHAAP